MSFIINVDRIPGSGVEISEDVPRDWLDNIPEFSSAEGTHLQGPIHIEVLVTREVNNIRIRGRILATLRTICTRCGEDVTWPIVDELDLVLAPAKDIVDEEDHEITAKELDENFYYSSTIELDDYFREQIALDLPMTFLCREDCRGLCGGCGANLNVEQCRCKKEEGDPRWAALKGLKIK